MMFHRYILIILTCIFVYSLQTDRASFVYAADLPCMGSYLDANGNVVNVCPPSSNNAPTDLFLNNTSITENSPIGTVVGLFKGTDSDAGDTLTYSLASGEGATDNTSFVIQGNELKTNVTPDHEKQSSYSIRVRVTDKSGASFDKVFTLSIMNVSDQAPNGITLNKTSVPENSPIGTEVGLFKGSDPDQGDILAFSLASGEGATDNSGFEVVGSALKTKVALDYEKKSSYNVRVRLTDGSGLFFEKSFIISVTNVNEIIALRHTDVARNSWYFTPIENMSADGYVTGVSQSQFKPNQRMTRAEYTAIIVRVFAINPSSTEPMNFKDMTSSKAWFYDAVRKAFRAKLVGGNSQGQFQPNAPITREQALVILARAIQYKKIALPTGGPAISTFKDVNQVTPVVRSQLDSLTKARIVGGNNARLLPRNPITRAESTVMLYRAMEILYPPLTIKDANLKSALQTAVGKQTLNISDLQKLTSFTAIGENIVDLSGLEHATNLKTLDVRNNKIVDVSPIRKLNALQQLDLSSNQIEVLPTWETPQLTNLNLSFNRIENIASLASLKKLQTLKLQENRIKTIDSLSGLTTLTTLEMSTNEIGDLTPLSTLTALTSLGVRSNKLTTLQSLNNLTKLTDLDAASNQIAAVSPLANKLQLTRLILAENRIRDFSPLSALINITFLSIADNLATDYSFMAGYPANGTYFTESTELIDENIPKTEIISRYATLVSDLTTVVNNIKSQTNDSSQQLDRLYQTLGERLEFNYETEKYRNVNLYEVYYSKKTICYGYAKLFALGAQLLGYDAIVISGEITDSKTAHAWTLVKIDGQWRHFDLTWDDAGASLVNRIYYNKSDAFMKNNVSAGKRAWEYDEYPGE